jgi:hypothetical protein
LWATAFRPVFPGKFANSVSSVRVVQGPDGSWESARVRSVGARLIAQEFNMLRGQNIKQKAFVLSLSHAPLAGGNPCPQTAIVETVARAAKTSPSS